jgi:hypothetical protein
VPRIVVGGSRFAVAGARCISVRSVAPGAGCAIRYANERKGAVSAAAGCAMRSKFTIAIRLGLVEWSSRTLTA